jgi:stage IV sporulation protein FB
VFFGIPQQTPLDLRFRLFGIPIRVHPMHWLFSAVLGWGWYADGGKDLIYLPCWLLAVFVSVLIHELGHVLMGRLFGSDGHILLWSFGGLAIGASDLRQRWQRILVSLAGPAIQFVLLGIVFPVGLFLVPLVPEAWRDVLATVWLMFVIINLIWPIFNLLPIWPLDGGKVSREVLEGGLGHKGVLASLWVSIGLSGLLALYVLYNTYTFDPHHTPFPNITQYFRGYWNALFFALFAVSSFQTLQQENNRRNRWNDELPWER